MADVSQWVLRGPIELRSAVADLNRGSNSQRIDPAQVPNIEAAALGNGWRWGLDWAPVIRWALNRCQGECPRPRGRPRKGEREGQLPD